MTATVFAAALLIGAVVLLWRSQERILFQPPSVNEPVPDSGRINYEAIDGQRLAGGKAAETAGRADAGDAVDDGPAFADHIKLGIGIPTFENRAGKARGKDGAGVFAIRRCGSRTGDASLRSAARKGGKV